MNEYQGIRLGDKVREIETGNTGKITEFVPMPDGMLVEFEDENGHQYGAYLHNCEFA